MREGFCNADNVVAAAILCLQTISENNVFSRGGVMDKALGSNFSVESLDKGGKSSLVKTVVALYLLLFIDIVRLDNWRVMHRVITSDNEWYNKWQQMTTNDNKWQQSCGLTNKNK